MNFAARLVLALVSCAPPARASRQSRKGADIERRVGALPARMTLEEKVGQLAQYSAPFESDPKVQRAKEEEYKSFVRRGLGGVPEKFSGAGHRALGVGHPRLVFKGGVRVTRAAGV